MFKNLGRVSFYSHLLPFPKQTHWNKVSTCVGVLGNPAVTIGSLNQGRLHLTCQKRLKDLPNLNPFHGLLVYCCSLTYHRPKQSFCLSNSWLAIVQEPHVPQERSSETIMANPLLLLVVACFFVKNLSQPSVLSFLLCWHSVSLEIRWALLDLENGIWAWCQFFKKRS